ncbi:hypothetical protein [Mycolicibacterium sp. XJ870]
MAGLLVAGAVSEFYRSVTVIERDTLPDKPDHRKGVPQSRHLHSFLTRGPQMLDMLFPGLLDELAAAGAVVVDDANLSRIYARIGRYELNQTGTLADPAALRLYLASRPFTEFHVRRRVQALANVTVLDGHDMVEPVVTSDSVTAVRVLNRDNGIESMLDSDLFIDARGRGTRTPPFLQTLNYGTPVEQTCSSPWAYSSQLLSLPDPGFSERMVMINNGFHKPRALLVAHEHGRWMLAIARANASGPPPSDFAGMLASAEEIFPERMLAGLTAAQPIGDVAVSRNTNAVWRRYDLMTRFPAGFLVTGDALCSLNPLYGQGMTMAALQAVALRDCLRSGRDDLGPRFFAAAAGHIGPTWARNRANDRVPEPTVRPTTRKRLQKWMMSASLNAAATDVRVAEQFLRVNNLVDPPARLRQPAIMSRILMGGLRKGRA